MTDVQVTMVPKELYYHEVAYVRGLEARNAELVAALGYVLEDDGMLPRATSKCRDVVRAALAAAADYKAKATEMSEECNKLRTMNDAIGSSSPADRV